MYLDLIYGYLWWDGWASGLKMETILVSYISYSVPPLYPCGLLVQSWEDNELGCLPRRGHFGQLPASKEITLSKWLKGTAVFLESWEEVIAQLLLFLNLQLNPAGFMQLTDFVFLYVCKTVWGLCA